MAALNEPLKDQLGGAEDSIKSGTKGGIEHEVEHEIKHEFQNVVNRDQLTPKIVIHVIIVSIALLILRWMLDNHSPKKFIFFIQPVSDAAGFLAGTTLLVIILVIALPPQYLTSMSRVSALV
jgi:hypothetical protein